jgi:protein arginine phosphatase
MSVEPVEPVEPLEPSAEQEVPVSRSPTPEPDTRTEGASESLGLLVICTGNAARSVMAGFMLELLAEQQGRALSVATAGTHSVDGQPISPRTRAGLASIPELRDVAYMRHRSRQMVEGDIERATLVIAMEADHVRYVRNRHPRAAPRTATIRRLAEILPPGPSPLAGRVASLELDRAPLDRGEDVLDPAGGDDLRYVRCAAELWELCQVLVQRL